MINLSYLGNNKNKKLISLILILFKMHKNQQLLNKTNKKIFLLKFCNFQLQMQINLKLNNLLRKYRKLIHMLFNKQIIVIVTSNNLNV